MNHASEKFRLLLAQMMIELDEEFGDEQTGPRHFDLSEQDALTPDARGWLLELARRGEIRSHQRELVIYYASQLGGRAVDREELEQLLDRLLFLPSDDETESGRPFGPRLH